MKEKTKIIYHANCMDGLASVYIAKTVLESSKIHIEPIKTIPLQYGDEQVLFGRHETKGLVSEFMPTKNDVVYFVDFSLKRDLMIELASKVKEIIVLDHHKTAEQNLNGLEDELENVKIIFDMNKSGATLCYEYFEPNYLNREIFDYIEDRDLWRWKLPYSKEVSAGIKHGVEPNNIDSFEASYYDFDVDTFRKVGEVLQEHQEYQVASKIKKTKDITIQGVAFKALNVTENISEVGNAICTTYDTPALMYFFTPEDEVVCSLRSIDTLADVSVVAKALGGGGHRNACGFTLGINEFYNLINIQTPEYSDEIRQWFSDRGILNDRLADLERVIRDWYVRLHKCEEEEKCKHEGDVEAQYDHLLCRECGIAKQTWFKDLDEAKFYRKNGYLPNSQTRRVKND